MSETRFIDAPLIADLLQQAEAAPRRRAHLNLHARLDDPAQRLLVAICPDSYVRPHCHLAPTKAETLWVLQGALGVLVFDETGQISDARRMEAGGACWGYDVPPGVWHSIVCLGSGTVFAEAKAGPYTPLVAAEWAPWAPEEGSPEAPAYRAALQARF